MDQDGYTVYDLENKVVKESIAQAGADPLVAFHDELDAVRDFEARLLARVLHGAHELAREPFATQIVVERRVEPDEVAALFRAGETLGRRALDEEIRWLDRELALWGAAIYTGRRPDCRTVLRP